MATLYQNYSKLDVGGGGFYGTVWYAQTFTVVTAHSIGQAAFYLHKEGSPGDVTVSVRATSGGLPTGEDLASGTISEVDIPVEASAAWVTVVFSSAHNLSEDTKYALVLRAPAGSSGNGVYVYGDDSVPGYTTGDWCGSANSGVAWGLQGGGGFDFSFREYSVPTTATYPTDAITRVTGLVHRYDRRKGIYQLEISLGDTTSVLSLPSSSTARRATAAEQEEQDNAPVVEEAKKEAKKEAAKAAAQAAPPVPPQVTQPAQLTQYAKDVLESPAGKATQARRKGLEFQAKGYEVNVITPYAINVLKTKEDEARTLMEIQKLTTAAKARGITSYARTALLKKIAQLRQQLAAMYR